MDDVKPQTTTEPISDDQELAKVLAGVKQESNNLSLEETPLPTPVAGPDATFASKPKVVSPPVAPTATQQISGDGDLDGIKKDALTELRPLVDKLDLEPEEKFDTYLLLIRSTDDKTLIAPAHTAAQSIADETRRAQALLDIIKEIDYLSPSQPAA